MATFYEHQDDLKTCPYNRCHKVAARRYQAHVAKCAKQSSIVLKECQFNSSHRVPHDQYEKHLETCPDSRVIVREIIQRNQEDVIKKEKEESEGKKEEKQPFKKVCYDDDEEDEWSSAGQKKYLVPGLDKKGVEEKLANQSASVGFVNPMVIQGMAPAERRQFYQKQVELQRKTMESDNHVHVKARGRLPSSIFTADSDGDFGGAVAAAATPLSLANTVETFSPPVKEEGKPKLPASTFRAPHAGFGGVGRGKRPPLN